MVVFVSCIFVASGSRADFQLKTHNIVAVTIETLKIHKAAIAEMAKDLSQLDGPNVIPEKVRNTFCDKNMNALEEFLYLALQYEEMGKVLDQQEQSPHPITPDDREAYDFVKGVRNEVGLINFNSIGLLGFCDQFYESLTANDGRTVTLVHEGNTKELAAAMQKIIELADSVTTHLESYRESQNNHFLLIQKSAQEIDEETFAFLYPLIDQISEK